MWLYYTCKYLMGNFSLLESYCGGIVCALYVNLKSVYPYPPIVKILWRIEPYKFYFSVDLWNIVSIVFAEIQLFVWTHLLIVLITEISRFVDCLFSICLFFYFSSNVFDVRLVVGIKARAQLNVAFKAEFSPRDLTKSCSNNFSFRSTDDFKGEEAIVMM